MRGTLGLVVPARGDDDRRACGVRRQSTRHRSEEATGEAAATAGSDDGEAAGLRFVDEHAGGVTDFDDGFDGDSGRFDLGSCFLERVRHGRADRAVVDRHIGHVDGGGCHARDRVGADEADRAVEGACFLDRPGQGVAARRRTVDSDDDGFGLTGRGRVGVLGAILLTLRKLLGSKRTSVSSTLEHIDGENFTYVTSLSELRQHMDNTVPYLGRCPVFRRRWSCCQAALEYSRNGRHFSTGLSIPRIHS